MARKNDTEQELRDGIREWAKTAGPGEEPHDFISEEADRVCIYHSDVIAIINDNDLWDETPDLEPRDGTLMSLASVVAYGWAEGVQWDEWRDIENEREAGEIVWCDECDEWVPDGNMYVCEDCETQEHKDHTTIEPREEFHLNLCESCYETRKEDAEEAEEENKENGD